MNMEFVFKTKGQLSPAMNSQLQNRVADRNLKVDNAKTNFDTVEQQLAPTQIADERHTKVRARVVCFYCSPCFLIQITKSLTQQSLS